MELFTILGVCWAAVLVLRFIVARSEATEKLNTFREEADKRIRVVQLESLSDNTILAYDGENRQFLGQGTSVEEVKARIMERFPEKIFLLDNKVFSRLKLNIETNFENSTTR
jgi:hypothetical protein